MSDGCLFNDFIAQSSRTQQQRLICYVFLPLLRIDIAWGQLRPTGLNEEKKKKKTRALMTLNSFIVNFSEFLLPSARFLAMIHSHRYLTRRSKMCKPVRNNSE